MRRNGYKRKRENADKEMMVTEEEDKDFLGVSLGAIFKDWLHDRLRPDLPH